jgi:uncharacterized protein (TIRG00374 family)
MNRGEVRVWLHGHHFSAWLAGVVGLAGIATLILVINPAKLGLALEHFQLSLVPAIVAASLCYYVLQGVRWHFLLRDVGARLAIGETILINLAAQVTTLLPLGELTRVALAARAARIPFSDALATVTVEELTYGLLLVVVAVPGLFEFHLSPAVPAAALLVAVLALAVLTVPQLFHVLHNLMSRILGLRRLLGPLDELQAGTVSLLHRRDTLGWSVITLVQVAAMTTVFWLVVTALDPGALTWPEAASVYAVASMAGAISFIPGGLGASEATFAGLMIVVGLPPAQATAVALMQRVADQGVATASGLVAYVIAQRRYQLGKLFSLQPGRAITAESVAGSPLNTRDSTEQQRAGPLR